MLCESGQGCELLSPFAHADVSVWDVNAFMSPSCWDGAAGLLRDGSNSSVPRGNLCSLSQPCPHRQTPWSRRVQEDGLEKGKQFVQGALESAARMLGVWAFSASISITLIIF